MKGLSTFWWLATIGICIALLTSVESMAGVKGVAVTSLFLAIAYGLDARLKVNALIDLADTQEESLQEAVDEYREQLEDLVQRIEILERTRLDLADAVFRDGPADHKSLPVLISRVPKAKSR